MPDAAERRPLRRSVRQRLIVQLSEQASELQRQLEAADADVGATAGEGIVCLAVELRRFQRQQGEHRPASLAGRLLSIAHAQWEPWLRAALQLIQWLPSSIGERTGGPTGEPTAGASADSSLWERCDSRWTSQLRKAIDDSAQAELQWQRKQPAHREELYEAMLGLGRRRQQHGAYYTPRELADFLVAQADQQLIEMGYVGGLLDESVDRSGRPAVNIVDPAAGNGAFIEAILRFAHRVHARRFPQNTWQSVADRLLHRLGANELMPVAAAIGQLRTVWQLLKTGYVLHEESVADWVAIDTLATYAPASLAHRDRPTVIIGNPPYQGAAALEGGWIEALMRGVQDGEHDPAASYFTVDGKPLNERKIWLHDNYIRFLRWAQWCVEVNGWGVVSLVLNHGLFDNITFRGVREKLLRAFDSIHLVDLHGSTKARETAPDGSKDENVFAIATGVAGICLARRPERRESDKELPEHAIVHRTDLWGARDEKLEHLANWMETEPPWRRIPAQGPDYLLVEDQRRMHPQYERAPSLPELMPVQSTAPVTARDRFLIDRDRAALVARLSDFADLSISDDIIRQRYFQRTRSANYPAGDTRGWKLHDARRRLAETENWQQHIRQCLYRPFDWRYILWLDWMIDWPRPKLTGHLLQIDDNIALIARRQMLKGRPCNYFWSTRCIALDGVIRSDNRGSESLFPLWRLNDDGQKTSNFDPDWADRFATAAELQWTESAGDLQSTLGPADLLSYIYGVFFTPDYRNRFDHFLRRDFPRVPLPGSRRRMLRHIAAGKRLLELHTSTPPAVADRMDDSSTVEPSLSSGDPAWQFAVGGYEVVRKWLRAQRGEAVTRQAAADFRHMVEVIRETAEIQGNLGSLQFDASEGFDYR